MPNWIESVKFFSDEIIAVDTGSTDRSCEILREAGIEPLYFEWINDFSAAKNFALDHATGDWVVFLDADEYFPPGVREHVRHGIEEVSANAPEAIAIQSPLLNIDEDLGNKITSRIIHWRIIRNIPEFRYKGAVHESLSYEKGKVKFADSDLVIYHTGYSTVISHIKGERNLKLLQKKVEEEGGTPDTRTALYLAVTYAQLMDYKKAQEYAWLAIQGTDDALTTMAVKMYKMLIQTEEQLDKNEEKIREFIELGLNRVPDYPDILIEKAKLCHKHNKLYEMDKICQTIVEKMADYEFMSRYESCMPSEETLLSHMLAVVNYRNGNLMKAREYLVRALQDNPTNALLLEHFSKFFFNAPFEMQDNVLSHVFKSELPQDKQKLKKGLANHEYNATYIKYVKPPKNSFEYYMSSGQYKAAGKLVKERLLALYREGGKLYAYVKSGSGDFTERDREILITAIEYAIPERFLYNFAKQGKPKRNPEAIVLDIRRELARLCNALLSMTKEEFKQSKKLFSLLTYPVSDMVLAAFDEPFKEFSPQVLCDMYGAIMTHSTFNVDEKIATCAAKLKVDEVSYLLLPTFFDRYEAWLVKLLLDSMNEKSGAYYRDLGRLNLYLKNKEAAVEVLTKAKEMIPEDTDVENYLGWAKELPDNAE